VTDRYVVDGALRRLVGATGSEVLVAALVAHGVDVVWGIPGTHNLGVFDALRRHGVRTVATTHEQGAGYAADGYARTARRPGVAIVTSGPAVYNAATALAQAYSDSSPVLLVSPGMPRTLPTDGPGTGYLHEAKDQQGAMHRIAAASLRPESHQAIAVAVAEAFELMTSGRPRPVHLEVPLDLLEERGDADIRPAPPGHLAGAEHADALAAADLLVRAERVLVVAGGGAVHASRQLLTVAELLGAPVVTTVNGSGAIPTDHPLSLGTRLSTHAVLDALDAVDAVLVVGSELGQSDVYLRTLAPAGTIVRVDIDAGMADVNVAANLFLHGDAAATLALLCDRLGVVLGDQPGAVGPWVAELRDRATAETAASGRRWLPWLEALQTVLDDDALLATDNAMCVYYGAIPNLTVRAAGSVLFPTGFGTLGFTVPVAIGAALAAPERQVVGISGDGGLLFTVTEIATAAAEQLPIVVVVFDNQGYGEIRNEMLARGETPVAVSAPPRDLVLLAQALGAHAVRVTHPAALATEVAAGRTRPGPTVIVVPEGQDPL
jgi:acetolactate synthase-1/2/3 large subunit